MSLVRFLLIHPSSARERSLSGRRGFSDQIFQYPVLSCLYVAASTPDYVETRILDEDVEEIDFDADVDVVGLSFMTLGAPRAYEIADRFRNERGIPVVMGGYHPTLYPDEASKHCDAVCVGDAEDKMSQIMDDFRQGNLHTIYNSCQPDLATIPCPDRSQLSDSGYAPIDTILATRGCPHRCTFCSITQFHGHTYRKRPVEDVVEELRQLRTRVLFVDDNLIADRDYAMELFSAIAPLKKRWYSQSSTQLATDDELVNSMVAGGCRGLFVGFESLSPSNLTAWKKGFNRPDAYGQFVDKMHKAGLAVFAGIVFGMDDDTPAVFRRTLEFLDEAKIDFAALNVLTPLPGTPLYDEMKESERIFDHNWGHYDFNHVVFHPRHMSAETLQKGTAWARAQFYRRNRVARRILSSASYLDSGTILKGVVPLNLGFRMRMSRSGTLRKGLSYVPA